VACRIAEQHELTVPLPNSSAAPGARLPDGGVASDCVKGFGVRRETGKE
jgi:hypothetical protein